MHPHSHWGNVLAAGRKEKNLKTSGIVVFAALAVACTFSAQALAGSLVSGHITPSTEPPVVEKPITPSVPPPSRPAPTKPMAKYVRVAKRAVVSDPPPRVRITSEKPVPPPAATSDDAVIKLRVEINGLKAKQAAQQKVLEAMQKNVSKHGNILAGYQKLDLKGTLDKLAIKNRHRDRALWNLTQGLTDVRKVAGRALTGVAQAKVQIHTVGTQVTRLSIGIYALIALVLVLMVMTAITMKGVNASRRIEAPRTFKLDEEPAAAPKERFWRPMKKK